MSVTLFRSLKEMQGFTVHAIDGDIGKVHEFYFDDEFWIVRYLVVDIGHWLPGRKVLIAPSAFREPDWNSRVFNLNLTRAAVEKSPDIDTAKPVSRQHEIELSRHFQWPPYWEMTAVGSVVIPIPAAPVEPEPATGRAKKNPHLRNTRRVIGYHLKALDGSIGRVHDFVVNDSDWRIQYVVVDMEDGKPERKVVISPWWVDAVRWDESVMVVHIPKGTIEKSQPYDAAVPMSRDYEEKLYDHYGKKKYWQ